MANCELMKMLLLNRLNKIVTKGEIVYNDKILFLPKASECGKDFNLIISEKLKAYFQYEIEGTDGKKESSPSYFFP